MSISAITTTHKGSKYQTAGVTLADGQNYQIHGQRSRVGRMGWDRRYVWRFQCEGPGLAHVAHSQQRERGKNWSQGGADFSYLNSVTLACSTMTEAKRQLAALLSRLGF